MKKIIWPIFLVLPSMIKLRKQSHRVHNVFWFLLCKYRINSSGSERLLKTQAFEKKAIFPVRKIFWSLFLSYYGVWQTVGDILSGSKNFSYLCCLTYKSIFQEPKRLLRTQLFEKKGQHFQWKKLFDRFFPCYRALKNSRNLLKMSMRYSGDYSGTCTSFF